MGCFSLILEAAGRKSYCVVALSVFYAIHYFQRILIVWVMQCFLEKFLTFFFASAHFPDYRILFFLSFSRANFLITGWLSVQTKSSPFLWLIGQLLVWAVNPYSYRKKRIFSKPRCLPESEDVAYSYIYKPRCLPESEDVVSSILKIKLQPGRKKTPDL